MSKVYKNYREFKEAFNDGYQLPKPYVRGVSNKISKDADAIYQAIQGALAHGVSEKEVMRYVSDAIDMFSNPESPAIYRQDMAMKYLGKSSRPWMEKKESNNMAKFNEYYDYEEPDYGVETTWEEEDFEDNIEIVFPKEIEFTSEFIKKLNVAFQYFSPYKNPYFTIFDHNIAVEHKREAADGIRNVNYEATVGPNYKSEEDYYKSEEGYYKSDEDYYESDEDYYESDEDSDPTIEVKDTEEGKVISISVYGTAEFEAELGAEDGFSYEYGSEHGYHSLGREIGDYYADDSDLHNLIVSDFKTMLNKGKVPYIKVK